MTEHRTPFVSASTLPYRLPPFNVIEDEHYRPAFEAGMAEQRAEVEAITAQDRQATFDDTMVALERSGQLLDRVASVFFNKTSSDSTPFTDELEQELAPLLAAHHDAITLDSALFARIDDLWNRVDSLGLDDESRYLLERYHTEFTLAGAGLGSDEKSELSDLNGRLASLTTRFEKNLLADANDLAVLIDDVSELAGLGEAELASAREAASERGEDGWLLTLPLFTGHPLLATLERREVRERIVTASRARGIRGGQHDNRDLVLEITRLRARRARVLGFRDHASAVTADETAGSPEAVADLLDRLAPSAARNARAEKDAICAEAGDEIDAVRSWDWAHYSDRVRRSRYDVDTEAMRPYFELERVLHNGVFFAAERLYGVRFTERGDLAAYHPDARVFEVTEEDGSPVGLYIADLFTRDSKRGGAWMNALVSQSSLLETPVVVVNNLNIAKPAGGSPALLTVDETETLFHEFGHALHSLFARVRYPRFSGTNVFRDVVEFPSQVNEMWMLWPEVLANYAVHHESGQRMPQELVDRLQASRLWGEGFATSEYLAAALLDQAWHRITADDDVTDVAAFEADALKRAGLDDDAVPPRYSSTYFAHTFSGGYDAGYYSYIWSEVMDADAALWFRENGGLTRENGDRFRRRLLGVGGSKNPLDAYRDFRGRDPVIEPLLKRRGLAPSE